MLQNKILLLLISVSLLFTSCSDTTTSGDNGDEEQPIEPQASVNNPSDGAEVEGEITFSVDGQSENGFDEARIFVGDEEVKTISDPELPYEQTIATYDWDNGDYDLRAELDVTDEDTTVQATISITFENYLVELQTDGYIANLSENTDATYLFIADPSGNVLREIELTSMSDGNIKLLPPSTIEGTAPEQISMTFGQQTTNNEGAQSFDLTTYVGFESWSNVNRTVAQSSGSENGGEIPVHFSDYPQDFPPYFNIGQDANYSNFTAYLLSATEKDTLPTSNSSNEVMLTALAGVENDISKYYLEQNLQDSLDGPNSLRIDVTDQMQDLSTYTVSIPSGYSHVTSTGYLQGEESFEETSYFFFDYGYPHGEDPASDEVIVNAPDIDGRTVGYRITLADDDQENVQVDQRIGGQETMPSSFDLLDASVEVTNNSLDDLQLDITGSSDYVWVYAENPSSANNSWTLRAPDSTTSFTYPSIADSLDSNVTVHNRSELTIDDIEMWDYANLDGYSSYISNLFGSEPPEYSFDFKNWDKFNISTQQNKISGESTDVDNGAAHETKEREMQGRGQLPPKFQH